MLERLFRKKELPFADLQVHSYFSDGHVSPERLLAHADELGLRVIAVTDHDSLDGTRAALEAASQFEVDVVPALELTTWWDTPQGSGEIDILGYFVDVDDATLKVTTHRAMDDIQDRIAETCRRLSEDGYPTTLDDIRATNPRYPAKAVCIWTLVEKHELSWATARDLFHEHFNRVRPCALSISDAIASIRAGGGVAVLAHPGRIKLFRHRLGQEQLGWLVEAGLQGIEVLYPLHDAADTLAFRTLAQHFGLVQTGGSDEHAYHGKFSVMGSQPVTEEMVEALQSAAWPLRESWSA